MQVQKKQLTDTSINLVMSADPDLLDEVHQTVLLRLARNVKVQGFRSGKAPLNLIEKQLEPGLLQTEFLDEAVNRLYAQVVSQENLRPVDRPRIELKKFVPFTTLEVEATVDVVGQVKLPDYSAIKHPKPVIKVTADDVTEVVENLRTRMAERKEVKRIAKDGDEVVIDFAGLDSETKDPVNGADGKDYPLVLGSNTFIPGFEPNLVGMKAGETKEFEVTFPKDYGVAALQSKKVTFTVTVKSVSEIKKPKADDDFAKMVGPFASLAELKANIKEQVTADRQQQADRQHESELLEKIAAKATVAIPDSLVDEEVQRLEQEERQNLMYRGQTWQEHLAAEGVTEEEHRQRNREPAKERVKAGLVLSEIAEKEKIDVTPEELDRQIALLKGQYTDPQMQAELDKPENRRDIASRLLTEKTLAALVAKSDK